MLLTTFCDHISFTISYLIKIIGFCNDLIIWSLLTFPKVITLSGLICTKDQSDNLICFQSAVIMKWLFSHSFELNTLSSGVFVITHIQSCRNGAGYCILGFSCEVDKDFMADDLDGNCDGLGAAFNPVTHFVCCRENPDNVHEAPAVSNKGEDSGDDDVVEAHGTITTTTPTTTTTTSGNF